MEFVDAHAHITKNHFEDVQEVLKNAEMAGVKRVVCSGFNFSSSKEAVELSEKFENVYAVVGFHPENTDEILFDTLKKLEMLAKHIKVVAIGEIGLDYHSENFDKDKQREFFIKQIELANKLKKPIVVHTREAIGDTIEILREHPPICPSLLHCFSGSEESAKELLKLNFSFSIGGVVTFKNARNLPQVVEMLPLDRILLETDCPFMSPAPFRGQKNEPKNVVYIADKISKLKGISLEEVAKVTTENAERLFNI